MIMEVKRKMGSFSGQTHQPSGTDAVQLLTWDRVIPSVEGVAGLDSKNIKSVRLTVEAGEIAYIDVEVFLSGDDCLDTVYEVGSMELPTKTLRFPVTSLNIEFAGKKIAEDSIKIIKS